MQMLRLSGSLHAVLEVVAYLQPSTLMLHSAGRSFGNLLIVVFVISQLPMFDVGERRRPLSTVGWRDFPAPSAIDADSGRSVDLSFAQTPAHRLNPFYTASDYYYYSLAA
jgi:hypothetical protein